MIPIRLNRPDSSYAWGFRLEGGVDLGTLLTIQRVKPNSIAAHAGLVSGDVVLQINTSDARHMRHDEAKMEIIRSCNDIDMYVQRGGNPYSSHGNNVIVHQPTGYHSSTSPRSGGGYPTRSGGGYPTVYSPPSVQRGPSVIIKNSGIQSSGASKHSSSRWNANTSMPSQNNHSPNSYRGGQQASNGKSAWNIGAQHNAIPAPFTSNDGRTQQVVHKQFNSPMGLYSAHNMSETMHSQVGVHASGPVSPGSYNNSAPSHQHQHGGADSWHSNSTSMQDCGVCGEPIRGGIFLKVQNRVPIHQHCLVCSRCGLSLKNRGYFFIRNKLYCDNHAA